MTRASGRFRAHRCRGTRYRYRRRHAAASLRVLLAAAAMRRCWLRDGFGGEAAVGPGGSQLPLLGACEQETQMLVGQLGACHIGMPCWHEQFLSCALSTPEHRPISCVAILRLVRRVSMPAKHQPPAAQAQARHVHVAARHAGRHRWRPRAARSKREARSFGSPSSLPAHGWGLWTSVEERMR